MDEAGVPVQGGHVIAVVQGPDGQQSRRESAPQGGHRRLRHHVVGGGAERQHR
ncbi:hypothetical protein ACFFX0_06330 [Citricoccus parietis]|uniref:Uncharacterized protein n=1 Tax=Citricoccus parietis TaxID=592307 RepID=A0ABV5FVX7_9MICC